jgi:hypothetical protein
MVVICAQDARRSGSVPVSDCATYQASEIQSVNTSAFYGIYVSSSRSGSIGAEKSVELYKRTES